MNKITLAMPLALLISLSACSGISKDGSMAKAEKDFQHYQQVSQQFPIDSQWWLNYQNPQLNQLIEQALARNLNLAKAAIAVNTALYKANLVGANLVPTFSASAQSSATKGVGASHSVVSVGRSTINHQVGFNLSYTLDLWGRLRDAASAAVWEKNATEEDWQAARLSLINAVITSYHNLAYFHDAIAITEKNIQSYQQINQILRQKQRVGLSDSLGVDQSQQAVLTAQNALLHLQSGKKATEQVLRNLLNLTPEQALFTSPPTLAKLKLQGVDLNVPVSVIANRPDILASLNRLQSAFKNVQSMEKSWFPTLSLGASLSGSAMKINQLSDNPIGNGSIALHLPFLDWQRVSTNIKISEEGYKLAKLNYEQRITEALNEIEGYYFAYQQSQRLYANLVKKYQHDQNVSRRYHQRYQAGVAELREWLMALNTERTAELALLEAKFNQLKNENAVYQAMAGKAKH